jgi:4-hydroxy-tetrahydrodipicolinate reductase
MGQLVAALAADHGCEIAGIAEIDRPLDTVLARAGQVDVAIDFSRAEAVEGNLTMLAEARINVVVGTTGWQDRAAALRALVDRAGIGVLASANFSLGMNAFVFVVEEAARTFATMGDVGAWIHEAHHAAKRDAPSGTALMLERAMIAAGYPRPVDMSSTRAGAIPGTHVVGFDAAAETVTLTHAVRDRSVFAHGALEAAKWLNGRRGWFTMRDMIAGGYETPPEL